MSTETTCARPAALGGSNGGNWRALLCAHLGGAALGIHSVQLLGELLGQLRPVRILRQHLVQLHPAAHLSPQPALHLRRTAAAESVGMLAALPSCLLPAARC